MQWCSSSLNVVFAGAIAHSSNNGMSSTVQANNQSSSTETPAVTPLRDAANATSILDENLNSSSTISIKTTISSIAVITNATTPSNPAASTTGKGRNCDDWFRFYYLQIFLYFSYIMSLFSDALVLGEQEKSQHNYFFTLFNVLHFI